MYRDEQSSVEMQERSEFVEIQQLFPANPIYEKALKEDGNKPQLKVQIIKNQRLYKEPLKPVFKKQQLSDGELSESDDEDSAKGLKKYFANRKCIYLKYNNKECNKIARREYFASQFIDHRLFKQNKQILHDLTKLHKEIFNEDIRPEFVSKEVRFDSMFESGNLFAVFKKNWHEFDLILENDINSKGNTQWFYFSISNFPKDVDLTFNIVNLCKSDSLFNYGMQPVVFSEQKSKRTGVGWQRSGKSISYYKNTIKRQYSKKYYYTLTFKISSKYQNDKLYIAHCFPYTTKMLTEFIEQIDKNMLKRHNVTYQTIGRTVANNSIECMTITEKSDKKKDKRKIIIILSRQHPGQTQGSYVCEGIINFLLSKSKQSDFLRKNYIFKIVPMVNPDGVKFGNYRTNLMGHDLNRKWDVYDRQNNFPEVASIKNWIQEQCKSKSVKFILDLHGHSKKLNSFFYGNPNIANPESVRSFPFMCSKLNPHISYEDCTFTIQEQKKKAARVYLSAVHSINTIYTFESSFYGFTKENKRYPFAVEDYKNLGNTLGLALFGYLQFQLLTETKTTEKLITSVFSVYLNELKQSNQLLNMGNVQESGSQSNPEQCELKQKEHEELLKKSSETNSIQKDQEGNSPVSFKYSPLTHKGKREIKQQLKNIKQLKFMELNRVNAILPDKYELGLQPIRIINQMQKGPEIQKNIQKENFSSKNTEQTRRLKKSIKVNKICQSSQTDPLTTQLWMEIKPLAEQYNGSQRSIQSRPLSSRFKDNYELKYVSLTSTKYKKNMILKLDLMTRPLDHASRFLDKLRNTFSQTVLSSGVKFHRKKSKPYFPSVEVTQRQTKELQPKSRINYVKARLGQRQEGEDFLNQIVKKYLLESKQKTKTKPILSHKQKIFHQKSLSSSKIGGKQESSISYKNKSISRKLPNSSIIPKKG